MGMRAIPPSDSPRIPIRLSATAKRVCPTIENDGGHCVREVLL